ATAHDITSRKLAEHALRENEEKFRTLADQSPNMIFINRMGRIVYVNRKCVEIMGYELEEFYSPDFDFMTLVAPEHRETAKINFGRHRRGEEIPPHEYALLTKDNSRVESMITTKLIDYDGVKAVLGIITDISNLKNIEKALRESEAKYRDLYDNAPDMYHSLNKDGIIIECNETEARMLGYGKEEIIGRPLKDFFAEKSRKLFEQDFPRLNYRSNILNAEREFVRKDGTTILTNLNIYSEYDKDKKLLGTKAIARDITDLKKVEAELLKSQKLESISVLAGGIAHDFNNILTAILGNINFAKMSLKADDLLFERLSEAERACASASKLTHQLLTFSKGGEPIKKTLSLVNLIRDSAGLALRGSNVKCEFDLPVDLWPVEADEGQIGQAINNLVINAVQSMPEGGVINVIAKNSLVSAKTELPLEEGKYVDIAVKDHGIGIPKEHLQRIFDPYFTTKQKGSGLGLAIAYSIIKNHNGHITVKSNLGTGTTFHIYLPASPKPLVEKKLREERIVSGKGRILVMDDEDMVRSVICEILGHIGYEVGPARDGLEAIELYKKSRELGVLFDAVILDLTVPGGMGGKETIRKLLEIDPKVKAIASSGYSNDPVMANFREYGFASVIPKPYRIAEISKVLAEVLAAGSGNR
ncbi:MAG TPA: PAS domain S-box protein, partial [Thermodesulfovibrionales bacterium]|nr:PAS domain S-box protein [Thermodesulfovibrionales bacterium]